MFTRKKYKKFRPPKVMTIIGEGTAISGDIHFHSGLHIDGELKGNIFAIDDEKHENGLSMSALAKIEGEIHANNIVINGTVIGDIYSSERIELGPEARITGNVYYNLLEMAIGADVNGNLIHQSKPESNT